MVVQAPEIIGFSIERTCPLRLFQSISLISTLSPLNHLPREFVQQDVDGWYASKISSKFFFDKASEPQGARRGGRVQSYKQDANFPHQNLLQIIRTSKLPLSLLELGTLWVGASFSADKNYSDTVLLNTVNLGYALETRNTLKLCCG